MLFSLFSSKQSKPQDNLTQDNLEAHSQQMEQAGAQSQSPPTSPSPSRSRVPSLKSLRFNSANSSTTSVNSKSSKISSSTRASRERICPDKMYSSETRRSYTPSSTPGPRLDLTLRTMPLGASITYGLGSSHGNGYRQYLRNLLTADGFDVDYVGSRSNGTMEDNDVEGWSGLRIGEVTTKAQESVPDLQPNLVLINVGSNDCAQDWETDMAGDRMRHLLDYLQDEVPYISIVLSTLTVHMDPRVDDCIQDVNRQYRALVEDQQDKNRKVLLADMDDQRDGPTLNDLVDNVHPGDNGFEKMAKIWYKSIKDADERGWFHDEQPSTESD